jgi:uncharacterized YigZ family protein
MSDLFRTIAAPSEAQYKEKMSRFLAFIHPVKDVEEAKAVVKDYQNKYHDARHVCWAYMLGPARVVWQLNDNGEPSGTAGKPILGQINSFELTDVVAVVVRYFGGIKLGTSGLIAAYREATRLAIENAEIVEMHETCDLEVVFSYIAMNDIMKVVKSMNLQIVSQDFDNTCRMVLRVRKDHEPQARRMLGIEERN